MPRFTREIIAVVIAIVLACCHTLGFTPAGQSRNFAGVSPSCIRIRDRCIDDQCYRRSLWLASSSSGSSEGIAKRSTNRDKRISKLLESIEYERVRLQPEFPLERDPMLPLVETVLKAADKRKATEMTAFRVYHLTEMTQFMVLLVGNSKPQIQAIASSIEEDVALAGAENSDARAAISSNTNGKPLQPSVEGTAASGWILLDYGPMVVHVMTPQMKNFYKLERKWKDAEFINVAELLGWPDSTEISSLSSSSTTTAAAAAGGGGRRSSALEWEDSGLEDEFYSSSLDDDEDDGDEEEEQQEEEETEEEEGEDDEDPFWK